MFLEVLVKILKVLMILLVLPKKGFAVLNPLRIVGCYYCYNKFYQCF